VGKNGMTNKEAEKTTGQDQRTDGRLELLWSVTASTKKGKGGCVGAYETDHHRRNSQRRKVLI